MVDDHSATIVVGVDGSDTSQLALEWALRFAGTTRRTVRAASVCVFVSPAPSLTIPSCYTDADSVALRHHQILASAVRQAHPEKWGVRIETSVLHGEPGRALCALADGASALVLGNPRYGVALSAVLGSVSSYCVRHANCPVIVVPPDNTHRVERQTRNAHADSG